MVRVLFISAGRHYLMVLLKRVCLFSNRCVYNCFLHKIF